MPVNPRKNRASSELLYKSNRPQVSMCYGHINNLGYVGRTLEEFVNHSPAARGLQILLAFYQHSVIPEVMKTGSGVNLNFLSNFSQLLLSNICFFRLCCSRLMSGFFCCCCYLAFRLGTCFQVDRQTDMFIWSLIQREYVDYNFEISKNYK